MTHKEAGACACLSACQRACSVTNIGGKDSVKGNRQGSLSRPITRRSDQNRKIKCSFYFAILPASLSKKSIRTFSTSWQALAPASLCCRRGAVGIVPLRTGTVSRCRGRRPRRPVLHDRRTLKGGTHVSRRKMRICPTGCCGHRPLRMGTMNRCRGRRPDVPVAISLNLQNPTTKTEEDVV